MASWNGAKCRKVLVGRGLYAGHGITIQLKLYLHIHVYTQLDCIDSVYIQPFLSPPFLSFSPPPFLSLSFFMCVD